MSVIQGLFGPFGHENLWSHDATCFWGHNWQLSFAFKEGQIQDSQIQQTIQMVSQNIENTSAVFKDLEDAWSIRRPGHVASLSQG